MVVLGEYTLIALVFRGASLADDFWLTQGEHTHREICIFCSQVVCNVVNPFHRQLQGWGHQDEMFSFVAVSLASLSRRAGRLALFALALALVGLVLGLLLV